MKKTLLITILLLVLSITAAYSFNSGSPDNKKTLVSDVKLSCEEIGLTKPEKTKNINLELKIKPKRISSEERVINNFTRKNDPENEISLENVKTKNNSTLMDKIKRHTVKKGETLWVIAKKYDINIDTLIGANNISNMNQIKPGQVIKILPVKGILYKIGPGENLSTIAVRFDISILNIVESNNIENPNKVQPGRMLILPGAKPEFSYQDRLERLFTKPVNARISSYYGMRWGRMHEGIDFAVNTGTTLRAAGSGKIVYSGWAHGYGKTIIIEHQKGLRTLYAHNSQLLVHSGEWVRRGEAISKSGNTGNSTGPHLHFEVQVNGRPVNPMDYLRK